MKADRNSNKITCIVFGVVIYGLMLLNFLAPDKTVSDTEKRQLQMFPEFSFESLKDGSFTSDFETYISDQFVLKDYFVGYKTKIEKLLLKKDNNGIYLGEDDYLLSMFDKPGEQLDKNIDAIVDFYKDHSEYNISTMIIPLSSSILKDKLPLFATPYDGKNIDKLFIEKLNQIGAKDIFIPIYDVLEDHQDEEIYYKTDHHWTTLGAYYGYASFAMNNELIPVMASDFEIEKVTENFQGSYYVKAGDYSIDSDVIERWLLEGIEYTAYYHDVDIITDSIYDASKLGTGDDYAYFTSGNHDLIEIETNANSDQSIVIFKDSYANSMIPFLLVHYKNIYVIDLRFFNESVESYIQEKEVDDILFLYGSESISKDFNIGKINH